MGNLEITIASSTTRQEESFMAKKSRNQDKKKNDISAIVPTDEKLTSRAGLGLYAGYLRRIELFPMIDRWFGSMRKNRKGIAINELFVQILSYFMDGTSRHLTRFDQLGADEKVTPCCSALIGWPRLMPSSAFSAVLSSGGCSSSASSCRICSSGD